MPQKVGEIISIGIWNWMLILSVIPFLFCPAPRPRVPQGLLSFVKI
jgi:hypothetical protein